MNNPTKHGVVEAIVKKAGERMFHVPAANFSVSYNQKYIWSITCEDITITGKILVSSNQESQLIFKVTNYKDKRNWIGKKIVVEIIEREEAQDNDEIIEAVIRKAGEEMFHVSAAGLYLSCDENETWSIMCEGITIMGKVYPDPVQESQMIFEVVAYQDERNWEGRKFTI